MAHLDKSSTNANSVPTADNVRYANEPPALSGRILDALGTLSLLLAEARAGAGSHRGIKHNADQAILRLSALGPRIVLLAAELDTTST